MAEGKVFIMSPAFALATLIELAISGLLIYGFMYEDKVIWFEQTIKRIVLGNLRRIIRISKIKKAKKKGLKIAIVFICMGMAGIFWQNRQTVSFNELALENVEALAQGESGLGNYLCLGDGELDCDGNKVAEVYSGLSLRH